MISRPVPPAFAALSLIAAVFLPASAFAAGADPSAVAIPPPMQPGIVYRSDETDATAQALSNQPQFSGCGIVYNGPKSELGTGTAIAPNWVLTAKHVVTGYTTATFQAANGQTITGTVYTDSATDMALIKLDSNLITASGQSFTPVALITPNLPGAPKVQPVGPLIWNVGYGNYGNYGGTVNGLDLKRRGGTNVVNNYNSSILYFTNNNTSGTEFECSTGPGDSGGPMYLQTGYQWRVAALVLGTGTDPKNGLGSFTDTDTSFNSFITATTGIAFAPQSAPTSLTWNATYLTPSSAASKNITNFVDGAGNWNTTRLNFVGATTGGDTYTYAWQNSTLLPVTFGKGSGAAGTVTVMTPINISDMTFAVTGGGAYNITGTSTNPLTLAAAGSSITVNPGVNPMVSAVLAGTGALTKLGTGVLTLSGTNAYSGGTNINVGGIQIGSASSLGASGNILIASGATLSADPLGTSTGFTLASGRTLTDNGSITGTFAISGTLTGTGAVGTGSSNNTLTVNAGGLISGAAGTLTIRNGFTNNGTITMPAGALLDVSTVPSFANNGALNLTGGNAKLPGNFTNGSNGVLTNTGGTLAVGSLTNNGTIRMVGGSVLDASAATYLYNYGVLDLINGSVKPPPGGIFNSNGGVVLTGALVTVKSATRTSTSFTLTIDSYNGHAYQLQRGSSPAADSFANLGSAQNGSTGTTLTFTDASPAAGQGFYRVVLTP